MSSRISEHNSRQRNAKRLKKNTALSFIAILLTYTPQGLSFVGYGSIENAFRIALVLCFIVMVLMYVAQSFRGQGMPIDSVFLLSVAMLVVLGFCTIVNNGSIPHYGEKVISLLGAWFIVVLFACKDVKSFIVGAFWAITIVSVFNIIGVAIMYPSSFRPIGDFWLFGQRNAMRTILYSGLFFSIARDIMMQRKCSIFTVYYLVSSPILLVLVQSMTSAVIVVVIEIFYAVYLFKKSATISPFKYFVAAFGVFEIGFVFLRRMDVVSNFLTNVLHRSLTLSSRTEIWDVAMHRIAGNPWIGTGAQTLEKSGLYSLSMNQFSHCHNMILEAIYKGGLFMLIFEVLLFIRCCIPLTRAKRSWFVYFLSVFLGSFIVAAVFADFWTAQQFMFLFMAAYCVPIGEELEKLD